MKLSKAEALALAEFAGIGVVDPDGIPYARHCEPTQSMMLSTYLLTAEGALRVLAVEGMKFDMLYHDWHSSTWFLVDDSAEETRWGLSAGKTPAEAIITAALQLPAVQELVRKNGGKQ